MTPNPKPERPRDDILDAVETAPRQARPKIMAMTEDKELQ
jgi:hypothetical protein